MSRRDGRPTRGGVQGCEFPQPGRVGGVSQARRRAPRPRPRPRRTKQKKRQAGAGRPPSRQEPRPGSSLTVRRSTAPAGSEVFCRSGFDHDRALQRLAAGPTKRTTARRPKLCAYTTCDRPATQAERPPSPWLRFQTFPLPSCSRPPAHKSAPASDSPTSLAAQPRLAHPTHTPNEASFRSKHPSRPNPLHSATADSPEAARWDAAVRRTRAGAGPSPASRRTGSQRASTGISGRRRGG